MKPIFENMLLLTIGMLVFWQVVIPVFRDHPIFPILRRDPKRRLVAAQRQYEEAQAELDLAKLQVKVAELQLKTVQVKEAEKVINKTAAAVKVENEGDKYESP
jgi:ribosomal protein L15